MNTMRKFGVGLFIIIISVCGLMGQNLPDNISRIKGDKLIIRINTGWDSLLLEEVINRFKLDSTLQLLFHNSFDRSIADSASLNVKFLKNGWMEIVEDITSSSENLIDIFSDFFLFDENYPKKGLGMTDHIYYGFNKLKNTELITQNDSIITIQLAHYKSAKEVFITGTFNNWVIDKNAMHQTATGWMVNLNLAPGMYYYKFIIDGEWLTDPNNKIDHHDTEWNTNSVLFVNNYQFRLTNYPTARKVILSGSFNEFDTQEIKMEQDPDSKEWTKDLYLQEGTHQYKYIVDNQWILDPENSMSKPDGKGNENSIVKIGEPFEFHLKGYSEAKVVKLTGDFIDWNPQGISMIKSGDGWNISYTLGPGNYSYKFIVDGNWIPDPNNPFTIGTDDYTNSVISIEPNYQFKLKGFDNAAIIYVAGSFSNWSENGYSMDRTDDGWIFPIHLSPGKHLYKYVVDGEWIIDPDNEFWEENEYGTGNSVLWIEN